MKCSIVALFAFLIITLTNTALAEIEAVTINGKRVLLKDDQTWEYMEVKQADARLARLTVASVQVSKNYCLIGLRLQNDLTDKITSLIFNFSAYVNQNVLYDTVTKGFQHLKPTKDMYTEISFSGISCDDIKYVRVHGADHCEIGELNKFSPEKGKCLQLVEVEPSDKIVIFKRYEDEPPQQEVVEQKESEKVSGEETVEEKWARELEQKKGLEDPGE